MSPWMFAARRYSWPSGPMGWFRSGDETWRFGHGTSSIPPVHLVGPFPTGAPLLPAWSVTPYSATPWPTRRTDCCSMSLAPGASRNRARGWHISRHARTVETRQWVILQGMIMERQRLPIREANYLRGLVGLPPVRVWEHATSGHSRPPTTCLGRRRVESGVSLGTITLVRAGSRTQRIAVSASSIPRQSQDIAASVVPAVGSTAVRACHGASAQLESLQPGR